MHAIATTTWNTADLVAPFLDHHLRAGFDCVLVMDFDSTDGTRDVLSSQKYQGVVKRIPYPGIAGLDSSAILLEVARQQLASDARCLFCDPDEFLTLAPGTSLKDLTDHAADALIVPRFNMTGRQSWAAGGQNDPLRHLNLRILQRTKRQLPNDMNADVLAPPWIFTFIKGKVFLRVAGTTAIGSGDHRAAVKSGTHNLAQEQAYLQHRPMRTFAEFERKIGMAAIDFAANPNLDPLYGWQLRRWIRLAAQDRLHEEYLQQFIPDADVPNLAASGIIAVDDG